MGTADAADGANLESYEASVRLPGPALVVALRNLLGLRLVAYIGSAKETRAVRQWAEGGRTPSDDVLLRLRMAYRVAAMLARKDSSAVVQAWFQGMNPRLDEVSPARLLREGDLEHVGPQILDAAAAFTSAARHT